MRCNSLRHREYAVKMLLIAIHRYTASQGPLFRRRTVSAHTGAEMSASIIVNIASRRLLVRTERRNGNGVVVIAHFHHYFLREADQRRLAAPMMLSRQLPLIAFIIAD